MTDRLHTVRATATLELEFEVMAGDEDEARAEADAVAQFLSLRAAGAPGVYYRWRGPAAITWGEAAPKEAP